MLPLMVSICHPIVTAHWSSPNGNHHFILKTQAWTLVIEKDVALTNDEIKDKLTPCA